MFHPTICLFHQPSFIFLLTSYFIHRVSTSLQNIIEPNHVAHDIGIRIGDAITYTSLGSEVHHHLRLILLKDAVNSLLVSNITLNIDV